MFVCVNAARHVSVNHGITDFHWQVSRLCFLCVSVAHLTIWNTWLASKPSLASDSSMYFVSVQQTVSHLSGNHGITAFAGRVLDDENEIKARKNGGLQVDVVLSTAQVVVPVCVCVCVCKRNSFKEKRR